MALEIKCIYTSAGKSSAGEKESRQGPIDVVVDLVNGEQYVASFFTYRQILELKAWHERTGEYLNGKYFFSKNMVLIDFFSSENIRKVIDHLIEEGEFREVFKAIRG